LDCTALTLLFVARMADLDYTSHYTTVSTDSEVLMRPNQRYLVKGQADFLAIALALEIPILSAKNNVPANSDMAASGLGRSFAVSRSTAEYKPSLSFDFVGDPPTHWFKRTSFRDTLTIRRHVTKKIVTTTEDDVDDARQLASITNEIRILASRSLRRNQNIVSLLFISWDEAPSDGRFWPQIVLECAEKGTLADYLQSKQLDFRTKISVALDIVKGLHHLHLHKVVHCDLKPANILIFADTERTQLSSAGIDSVVAKLCDFGFAVITSDYRPGDTFCNKVGSFPWMSPQLELGLPFAIDMLPKADVFSFGLVMASILMNGVTPFDGIAPEDITEAKRAGTAQSVGSAYTIVKANIETHAPFVEGQQSLTELLLLHTLAFDHALRSDWGPIFYCLKLGFWLGREHDDDKTMTATPDISSNEP
jgi:serine/threonine protein kinase